VKTTIEALAQLTSVVLGLFAGSLLTEALLLVPYFRSLTFAEFNRRHGEFGPRLFRYYAPRPIAAVVLPVASAVATSLTVRRLAYRLISSGTR
jgi:hypothetical protein